MMADSRSPSGHASRQPPITSYKEQKSTADGDQPDDDEKNAAHLPRPPQNFLPHFGCRNIPLEELQWGRERRECIIGFCERKCVVMLEGNVAEFPHAFRISRGREISRDTLTSFSLLSNIRRVYWGSSGMVRTSRCFKMAF